MLELCFDLNIIFVDRQVGRAVERRFQKPRFLGFYKKPQNLQKS